MPHVIVKLWPEKSEQKKTEPAERSTEDVMSVLGYGEESVSLALAEVAQDDWADQVSQPEIVPGADRLYKKPGYGMWE